MNKRQKADADPPVQPKPLPAEAATQPHPRRTEQVEVEIPSKITEATLTESPVSSRSSKRKRKDSLEHKENSNRWSVEQNDLKLVAVAQTVVKSTQFVQTKDVSRDRRSELKARLQALESLMKSAPVSQRDESDSRKAVSGREPDKSGSEIGESGSGEHVPVSSTEVESSGVVELASPEANESGHEADESSSEIAESAQTTVESKFKTAESCSLTPVSDSPGDSARLSIDNCSEQAERDDHVSMSEEQTATDVPAEMLQVSSCDQERIEQDHQNSFESLLGALPSPAAEAVSHPVVTNLISPALVVVTSPPAVHLTSAAAAALTSATAIVVTSSAAVALTSSAAVSPTSSAAVSLTSLAAVALTSSAAVSPTSPAAVALTSLAAISPISPAFGARTCSDVTIIEEGDVENMICESPKDICEPSGGGMGKTAEQLMLSRISQEDKQILSVQGRKGRPSSVISSDSGVEDVSVSSKESSAAEFFRLLHEAAPSKDVMGRADTPRSCYTDDRSWPTEAETAQRSTVGRPWDFVDESAVMKPEKAAGESAKVTTCRIRVRQDMFQE